MEDTKSNLILTNPDQEPNDKLLQKILSEQLYQAYMELQNTVHEIGLVYEWRFYRDGKSWLCKIANKKKTVAWLSIWEGFIKIGFYFTEKTRNGITDLNIDDEIKSSFAKAVPIGKLIPLVLVIDSNDKIKDFRKIAEYKMIQK
ncbi:MAG: DUF3788 family protein [Bacteroidales bacterium]|nr:DUF3788 family protein [Bacteroidales bacterium]MDD3858806.1 DUF3788 family protein [Bacteroidales bacterium]